MRPGEVLDAQIDLMERLRDTRFRDVHDAFGEMKYGRNGGFRKKGSTPQSEMLANAMRVAHAYRVTHDMSLKVEQVANNLPDLTQFHRKWAPTGAGFVCFDRPLPMTEVRGQQMLIHWLIWGPVMVNEGLSSPRSATLAITFNDRWRQPDEVEIQMQRHYREREGKRSWEDTARVLGRWGNIGSQPIFDEQRLGPALLPPDAGYQAELAGEGSIAYESTNVTRYVHALWMLMNQTITHVEDEHPDRPSRRRAERHRLPSKVTVIRLRRESGHTRAEGESEIEWQHRWMVRRHGAWRRCGPHHPNAEEFAPGQYRCWVTIEAYPKGPEDKPFMQSEKVYSLER